MIACLFTLQIISNESLEILSKTEFTCLVMNNKSLKIMNPLIKLKIRFSCEWNFNQADFMYRKTIPILLLFHSYRWGKFQAVLTCVRALMSLLQVLPQCLREILKNKEAQAPRIREISCKCWVQVVCLRLRRLKFIYVRKQFVYKYVSLIKHQLILLKCTHFCFEAIWSLHHFIIVSIFIGHKHFFKNEIVK